MSVSASATLERGSVSLSSYLDIVLVAVGALVALALGAPEVGLVVGTVAWVVVRVGSMAADSRIEAIADIRRRLGLGVVLGMARVWLLALTIIAVGITSTRENALAAALLIFGAFTVLFVSRAVAHRRAKRPPA